MCTGAGTRSTSCTPYSRARHSIRGITCSFNSCGSKRTILRPRRFAAVRWAPWTSTGSAKSTRCPRQYGTARRRCTVSRRNRETRWKTVTWRTGIRRRTRNVTWPGGRAWRSPRSAIGSRTGGSATGRPSSTGQFFFFISSPMGSIQVWLKRGLGAASHKHTA